MPVFRFKLKRLEAVGKGQFFVKNTSFDPESVFALKDALSHSKSPSPEKAEKYFKKSYHSQQRRTQKRLPLKASVSSLPPD
jgi:hypothetical protein